MLRLLHGVTAHASIWVSKVAGINPSFLYSSLRMSNAVKALNGGVSDRSLVLKTGMSLRHVI